MRWRTRSTGPVCSTGATSAIAPCSASRLEAEAHERFRSADADRERARKGAASAIERGADGRVAKADGEVGIPAVLEVLVAVGIPAAKPAEGRLEVCAPHDRRPALGDDPHQIERQGRKRGRRADFLPLDLAW